MARRRLPNATRIAAALLATSLLAGTALAQQQLPDRTTRPFNDEVIYFLLPDRFHNGDPSNDTGGIPGERLDHGFDPTHPDFFHGGDLKGLVQKLDYIQGLGATAIWLAPIYKNKPVQTSPNGGHTAGYHGYWVTDFTAVDPHFGTDADMKAFVAAAHARGMRVILDIITNHTADVIQYRECHDPTYAGPDKEGPFDLCLYHDKGTYPYTTRGGVAGEPINPGFLGDGPEQQTAENFARLTRPDWAYTPFIPEAEKTIKVPAWLNDPIYYHNRGESHWIGESSLYGDFARLDDLFTEHPRVKQGFIDIFKDWITRYRIDGFRVDTARHVNPEFWQAFVPAILEHARAEGLPEFYIFGEVADRRVEVLARHTRQDGLPGVLDFAFQQAVTEVLTGKQTPLDFGRLFNADHLYEGGPDAAAKLPVFLSNHDDGRIGFLIRREHPDMPEAELQARILLGHAIMFFARGVPTIYAGDEQGFIGEGRFAGSRETQFPSRTAQYTDDDLLGTDLTPADANFDTNHPMYRAMAEMAGLYRTHPTLRRGKQRLRLAEADSPLFVLSRLGDDGAEYLVAFNTETEPVTQSVETGHGTVAWETVRGTCPPAAAAPGAYTVTVPALDYVICRRSE